MVGFLYPHGVIYVFENSEAQRVKVGMTGIGVNNVGDRLRDVNAAVRHEPVSARRGDR
jgi:hypothetical protein